VLGGHGRLIGRLAVRLIRHRRLVWLSRHRRLVRLLDRVLRLLDRVLRLLDRVLRLLDRVLRRLLVGRRRLHCLRRRSRLLRGVGLAGLAGLHRVLESAKSPTDRRTRVGQLAGADDDQHDHEKDD
jgi:hypothetical protein